MDVVWEVLFALGFLGLYVWRRKTKGGWIWLLFVLLAPVVHGAMTNHFINNVPLVYGTLCLWVAGMIVPWYRLKKAWLWGTLCLIWCRGRLRFLPACNMAGFPLATP